MAKKQKAESRAKAEQKQKAEQKNNNFVYIKMSVNIFGSGGGGSAQSSKSDTKYVDRKFITLTTNLNSKMDKSGGLFSGNIDMGDNNITLSHTPISGHDVANKLYVDTAVNNHVLITTTPDSKLSSSHVPTEDDDVINKKYLDAILAHRLNDDDMKIIENRLSLKANKAGEVFTGAVDLGSSKISSTYIPTTDNDLVNRKYLKSIFVQNNSGYIPELNRNNYNDAGFTLTSSEEIPGYLAYFAFTSWKNHWLPSNRTGGWLQIECPNSVRIHKFALCGKKTLGPENRINSFSLLARKEDSVEWVQLFTTRNEQPLDNEVSFFHVNNTSTFKFFKLQIKGSIGDTPGVSFFQLFTLDSIA